MKTPFEISVTSSEAGPLAIKLIDCLSRIDKKFFTQNSLIISIQIKINLTHFCSFPTKIAYYFIICKYFLYPFVDRLQIYQNTLPLEYGSSQLRGQIQSINATCFHNIGKDSSSRHDETKSSGQTDASLKHHPKIKCSITVEGLDNLLTLFNIQIPRVKVPVHTVPLQALAGIGRYALVGSAACVQF